MNENNHSFEFTASQSSYIVEKLEINLCLYTELHVSELLKHPFPFIYKLRLDVTVLSLTHNS